MFQKLSSMILKDIIESFGFRRSPLRLAGVLHIIHFDVTATMCIFYMSLSVRRRSMCCFLRKLPPTPSCVPKPPSYFPPITSYFLCATSYVPLRLAMPAQLNHLPLTPHHSRTAHVLNRRWRWMLARPFDHLVSASGANTKSI